MRRQSRILLAKAPVAEDAGSRRKQLLGKPVPYARHYHCYRRLISAPSPVPQAEILGLAALVASLSLAQPSRDLPARIENAFSY